MILPTRTLSPTLSLLHVGGAILRLLDEPKTVSRLWAEFRRGDDTERPRVSYGWFVLALDVLFVVKAVDFDRGRVVKRTAA